MNWRVQIEQDLTELGWRVAFYFWSEQIASNHVQLHLQISEEEFKFMEAERDNCTSFWPVSA